MHESCENAIEKRHHRKGVDIALILANSDDKLALRILTTFETFGVQPEAGTKPRKVGIREKQQNYFTYSQNREIEKNKAEKIVTHEPTTPHR